MHRCDTRAAVSYLTKNVIGICDDDDMAVFMKKRYRHHHHQHLDHHHHGCSYHHYKSPPPTQNRWIDLPKLHSGFGRAVREFFNSLLGASLDRDECQRLLMRFYDTCVKFQNAKAVAFLSDKIPTSTPEQERHVEAGNLSNCKSGCIRNDIGYAVAEIVKTLKEYYQKNHAAMHVLMNKSMLVSSRLVLIGARCVVQKKPSGNYVLSVQQYVSASMGMVVAPVSNNNLINFSPVKGSVSAATAPNDKLPGKSYKTWADVVTVTTHSAVSHQQHHHPTPQHHCCEKKHTNTISSSNNNNNNNNNRIKHKTREKDSSTIAVAMAATKGKNPATDTNGWTKKWRLFELPCDDSTTLKKSQQTKEGKNEEEEGKKYKDTAAAATAADTSNGPFFYIPPHRR